MLSAEHTLKLRVAFGGSAAFIRFYGELNDFLPRARRGAVQVFRFDVNTSIKDAIEGLGVPHPEVDLIVANHELVGFSYGLKNGDYVSVYPAFHSIQLHEVPELRPKLERPPRFILDVHLGRLAAYLRLLGFDTLYSNDTQDPELAKAAAAQNRVLLTRDVGLLKRSEIVHGYWVRSTKPLQQLSELIRRFELADSVDLFTRCLICNTVLECAEKSEVAALLPDRTRELFDHFHKCPGCRRVYWKGSHYRRMLHLVGRTLREVRTES